MGKSKNNGTNFLVQGSILAVASIISRIIGLVYRIPLNNILGDVGISYYACAFVVSITGCSVKYSGYFTTSTSSVIVSLLSRAT